MPNLPEQIKGYMLFVDDVREPPEGYVSARSSAEANAIIDGRGIPAFVSFDHDLGGDDTGMRVVDHIIGLVLDGKAELPEGFSYAVHSANPVGANNIRSKMDCFLSKVR